MRCENRPADHAGRRPLTVVTPVRRIGAWPKLPAGCRNQEIVDAAARAGVHIAPDDAPLPWVAGPERWRETSVALQMQMTGPAAFPRVVRDGEEMVIGGHRIPPSNRRVRRSKQAAGTQANR
jgi:hypothetical protein